MNAGSVLSRAFRPTRAGAITLEASGEGIDPVMFVYRAAQSGWTAISQDDDSGEGLNARVGLAVSAGENYLVCVFSYGADGDATTATVRAQYAAPPPPIPAGGRRLSTGQPQSGVLSAFDDTLASGKRHQDWRYAVAQAQHVVITLSSPDFDPELEVFRSVRGELQSLAFNDDGGQGLGSSIETDLPPGQYVVRAQSHNRGSTGPFTLAVAASQPQPAAAGGNPPSGTVSPIAATSSLGRRIGVGLPVRESLAATDSVFIDGSYYDFWTFSASEGERYHVVMFSDAFTPYFGLGRLTGDQYRLVEGSTSHSTGGVAELVITIQTTGTYIVRANSLGAGPKTGDYTLLVTRVSATTGESTP